MPTTLDDGFQAADPTAHRLKHWLEALPESPDKAKRHTARTAAAQNRQLLEALRDSLRRLIDERGYTAGELVRLLKEQGVNVPASTLRAHVRKARASAAPPADPPVSRRARRPARPAQPVAPAGPAVRSRPSVAEAPRAGAAPVSPPSERWGEFTPREELPYDQLIKGTEA